MGISVGIDIAREAHWATALDDAGHVRLDHRLPNQPAALDEPVAELRVLEGEVTIGLEGSQGRKRVQTRRDGGCWSGSRDLNPGPPWPQPRTPRC
jgi:hypothetical protein